MEIIQRWMKNSSPTVKMFMAISVTSALVVVHRWFYSPFVKQQRYRQAEAWANEIIEAEERAELTGEPLPETYNLRY